MIERLRCEVPPQLEAALIFVDALRAVPLGLIGLYSTNSQGVALGCHRAGLLGRNGAV